MLVEQQKTSATKTAGSVIVVMDHARSLFALAFCFMAFSKLDSHIGLNRLFAIQLRMHAFMISVRALF